MREMEGRREGKHGTRSAGNQDRDKHMLKWFSDTSPDAPFTLLESFDISKCILGCFSGYSHTFKRGNSVVANSSRSSALLIGILQQD